MLSGINGNAKNHPDEKICCQKQQINKQPLPVREDRRGIFFVQNRLAGEFSQPLPYKLPTTDKKTVTERFFVHFIWRYHGNCVSLQVGRETPYLYDIVSSISSKNPRCCIRC